MLDGDLQDPPEVIPEMLERWREGVDVVYAVREQRLGETAFKRITARGFYRTFRRLTGLDLAVESGDFRLMDRKALDALLAMPERNRFLRGMTVWIGFSQIAVPFVRQERHAGVTKYPLRKMLRFSFDAITSFSQPPAAVGDVPRLLLQPRRVPGDPADRSSPATRTSSSAACRRRSSIVLLLGGIQLITLGIIGEYVGRIYDEVKHRPLYVVGERINVEEPADR